MSEDVPSGTPRRSSDWRRGFDRLKAALIAAKPETGGLYHHTVVWTEGEVPERVENLHPRASMNGHRVYRVTPVKLPDRGHLVHFIFAASGGDDGGEELRLLTRVLRDAGRILGAAPRRLIPDFNHPPAQDDLVGNLLPWFSLLHWLGHQPGNAAFRSILEYQTDQAPLSTREPGANWQHYSAWSDFDPVPALTCTPGGDKSPTEWEAWNESSGERRPRVIAASLSQPLWFASANALDQILLLDTAPHPRVAAGPVRSRSGNSESAREAADSERMNHLIQVLYSHHRPTDPDVCDAPLDSAGIAAKLEVSQSTVSRRMGRLMGEIPWCRGKEPMSAYRELCASTRIHRELIRLRIKYVDPKLPRLFTRENLDRLRDAFEDDEEGDDPAVPA